MTLPDWLVDHRKTPTWLLAALIGGAILIIAAATWWGGGTKTGSAQLILLPVVVAGAALGSRAGLMAGVTGGIIAALIPVDVATSAMQHPSRALFRLLAFAAAGYFVGYIRSGLLRMAAARSQFLSTVSHGLRTPLTSVVGYSETLYERRGEISDPSLIEMVDHLRLESFRLSHTLDQMIVAARLDTRALSVDRKSIDLRALLTEVIEYLPPIGASLQVELSGAAVAIGDRLRTTQILRNLLVHAAQFNGGRVAVSLTSNGEAEVTLEHLGGPLIDDPSLDVFTPFYQPRPTGAVPVERWIPLTVSRQLARLMDGDLMYAFADGKAVFRLVLPAAQAS